MKLFTRRPSAMLPQYGTERFVRLGHTRPPILSGIPSRRKLASCIQPWKASRAAMALRMFISKCTMVRSPPAVLGSGLSYSLE